MMELKIFANLRRLFKRVRMDVNDISANRWQLHATERATIYRYHRTASMKKREVYHDGS